MTDCDLCAQLYGRRRPATFDVVVPMSGDRPHYALCGDCLGELDAYCEDVRVLP